MDYIINRKYIFKSGSIFQPAMLVYRSLYDIIISHLRSSSQNLDHQNPEDSRRCPGPRLSLATARFLQPAGETAASDDFFWGTNSVEQACAPKKIIGAPNHVHVFFCLFFFRVGFWVDVLFTRCLEKTINKKNQWKSFPLIVHVL